MQDTVPRYFSSLFLAASFALVGCATVPKMGALPKLRAPEALASAQSFTAAPAEFPTDLWWKKFNDPALNALVEEGLANAPAMAVAVARLRAAEALAAQAGAVRAPSLTADASVGGEKLTQNRGFPPQFLPSNILSTGRIAASASFDPDLWGKNRTLLAAATSDQKAALVDVAQARLFLSTSIVGAYGELGQHYADRGVAADAVRIRTQTEALTLARATNGLDTLGDLKLAQSRSASARSSLAAIDEIIALNRNRIAALVGAGPDRGLEVVPPNLTVDNDLSLPENLTINLIGRRPDLVAARLRAEAAAARIKAAKADFYPDIKLSIVGGLQSVGLDTLFKTTSTFASFGPALRLPIFDGGALAARYRGSRATYDGAIANYDSTLIAALQEVADVIARKRALVSELDNARNAAMLASEAQKIMALRYQGGLANQLQLLAAEDAALNTTREAVRLTGFVMMLDIAMIRALGGGFDEMNSTGQTK